MAPGLASLLRLVEQAEQRYPHVTVARLRSLARVDPVGGVVRSRLTRLLQEGCAQGLLFSDNRIELTRTGQFRPIRVYRVNQRHPEVAALFED